MAIERTYNIPLRREWLKVPKYKRAKKAVAAIKKFLQQHMKPATPKELKLGKFLNLDVWKHGMKNPPHHIRINVTKDDKGIVRAELFGAKVETVPVPEKKGLIDKVKDAVITPKAKVPATVQSESSKAEVTTSANPASSAPKPATDAKPKQEKVAQKTESDNT